MTIGTNRKFNTHMLLFVVLLTASTIGLLLYNNAMSNQLSTSTCKTIGELMGQQRLTFVAQIESEAGEVGLLAELASEIRLFEKSEKEIVDFLKQAKKNTNFQHLTFCYPDGQAISSEDVKMNLSDRWHFKEAMAGKAAVTEPILSRATSTTVVIFSFPIINNGKVFGMLAGAYNTNTLSNLFFPAFDGNANAYICDLKGAVITRASNIHNGVKENILEYFKVAKTLQYDDYNIIAENMKKGLSGHAVYLFDGQKRLMHYSPIDYNGWYIFTTVPDEIIAAEGNYLMMLTVILTAFVLAVFIILMSYLIMSQRKYANLLYKKAYYNDLSGSPNLTKFREDASRLLTQNTQKNYAAMRISIEGLDFLNEIFSYTTGDKIIRAVAASFQEICNPQTDCFAHIYGDRFVGLFMCDNIEELRAKQAKFEQISSDKIAYLVSYKISFAIGLCLLEKGETDIYAVMEKVNFAHHIAKSNARLEDKVQEYDKTLKDALTLEREVEAKMEQALADGEFTMFLQPKYRLSDDKLEGAEALARWWVNGKYIMYPADFIPIFEKNGFVVKLDMFMFEQACKFVRNLIDKGRNPITISTNFSRLNLLKGGFVQKLCEIADRYNVAHKYLEIEITESSMLGNETLLKNVLAELHQEGFTLSMDDFGSGYSSLGLLKEIQIDVVKIDRSFFERSQEEKRDYIVIESVINMAQKLQIRTVAEGVETQEHIDFLRKIGCEIVQGYFFAKPMPFSEFEEKYF